ncbi:hemicentin-2, partial [Trichonephila inaurata madagascariensis]
MKHGQSCYLGERFWTHCRCPPTFIYNRNEGLCEPYGEHTYMIYDLPVVSLKYLNPDGSVDRSSLSTDIIQSIGQAYPNLEFVQLFNFTKDRNVTFCSVWLQFKTEPSSVNERWLFQTVGTRTHDVRLLPPTLLLYYDPLDKVKVEKLSLCSKVVKDIACGTLAKCSDDKCYCSEGYRTNESSVQTFGNKTILKCDDVDECAGETHICKTNTTCVNIPGDYYCKCLPGFKKKYNYTERKDKMPCN